MIETEYEGLEMTRKRHTAELVVNLLRQVEVGIANGKTTAQASKEASITEQSYCVIAVGAVSMAACRRPGEPDEGVRA